MKEGDIVLVDYVGRADGEIFDLTMEDVAEEENFNAGRQNFEPIPVLVGEGYVIPGFEEKVKEMEVGDEEEFDIPSEKAYGSRDSDNIETYPEKEFDRQDVNVNVGDELMIGRRKGRVISKGSGRVRIDFNHPLAGKDLHYRAKINEKVEDDEEKARYIFKYRLGHGEIEFEDDTAVIDHHHEEEDHQHEIPDDVRDAIREEIKEYTSFSEVEFREE
ncbi:MAG: peptidylprolyl isomerase [Candidatus Nanohaloarchaea archaeon]